MKGIDRSATHRIGNMSRQVGYWRRGFYVMRALIPFSGRLLSRFEGTTS